jgi:hypothetical protein
VLGVLGVLEVLGVRSWELEAGVLGAGVLGASANFRNTA